MLLRFERPTAGQTASCRDRGARPGMQHSIRDYGSGQAPSFGSIQRSIRVSVLVRRLASPVFPAEKLTKSATIILIPDCRECSSGKLSGLVVRPRRLRLGLTSLEDRGWLTG